MKRVIFLLLAFVLWLPVPLRAQDAEAISALAALELRRSGIRPQRLP